MPSSEEVEKRIKDKLSSRHIKEWDAQLILKSYSILSDFPRTHMFIDFCADNGWGFIANDIANAFCLVKDDEELWKIMEKYTEKFLKKCSDYKLKFEHALSFPTDAAKALIMMKNIPHVRKRVERFTDNCLLLSDMPEALVLLKNSPILLEKVCNFLENNELHGSAIGIAQAYLLVENDSVGMGHVDKAVLGGSFSALDAAKDYILLKKLESQNKNLHSLLEKLKKNDDNYSKALLRSIEDTMDMSPRYAHTTRDYRGIEEIKEQILEEAADKKELIELTELFSHADYKSFFENTEARKNVLNTLKSLGIAGWDDENYTRTYWTNKKKEEAFVKMEGDLYSTVGNVVNEILDGGFFDSIKVDVESNVGDKKLEELNRKKTAVTSEIKACKERGNQPPKELLEEIWGIGRELKAYQRGLSEEKNRARKLRVLEIKEKLSHVTSGIGNGSAKREQVIFLLDQLKNEYLEEGTKGYSKINEILELIPRGELLRDQIKTEIWGRNPWIDLSYGEEFYCCTSAGEMHEEAAISYMKNPAITMLDFYHPKLGRCMRAFLLATVDRKNRPFLMVDSVEGTDRIDFDVVERAIEDYASHVGFGSVMYNKKVTNSTPRKFIESISSENKVTEIYLSALYGTDEYLEAFPFRRKKPQGRVKGYLVKLD